MRFESLDFRKVGKYVAMHLTKEEQQRSLLARVLQRRTAKGGVRPCVSADPDNNENWKFPDTEMTELEERIMVATAVQIGVITTMNTHRYSCTGIAARIVMNAWDSGWLEVWSRVA
jgi:hypothetical protein